MDQQQLDLFTKPLARVMDLGGASSQNHYSVLDVEPNATRLQIREAYIRLKSTYGAGSAALYSLISEEEAREQLLKVEEAFRILSDDAARQLHDQNLGSPSAPASLMRDVESEDPMLASEEANVVRTTRSTLAIIKLKANKVEDEGTKAKLASILADSDPGDGDMYKRLREAAEVSEDEMQERTKVSIGYLRAIEGNRFERLPQAVYVKGFLRSYFRYLAVPEPERLVAAFAKRLEGWQADKKN